MIDDHRLVLLILMTGTAGVAMILGQLRWFRRVPLTARLAPFAAAGNELKASTAPTGLKQLILSFLSDGLEHLLSSMGIAGSLNSRLIASRSSLDAASFRYRQVLAVSIALGLGTLLVAMTTPPLLVALLLLVTPATLAILVIEQQLISRVNARRQRLFNELPVFAEQLALLLNAGYSLNASLARIADRSNGVASEELHEVLERNRQGVALEAALTEWTQRAGLIELDRLVSVLSLGPGTTSLGDLVSAEARAIRLESQRRLVETLDKRAQQVWIPVTVATLVPGVIFLAIPFTHALRAFSGS